jgi:hypothetical protein
MFVAGKLDGEYQRLSPEGPGLTIRGEFRGGKAVGTWHHACANGVHRQRVFATATPVGIDEWQHNCEARIQSK